MVRRSGECTVVHCHAFSHSNVMGQYLILFFLMSFWDSLSMLLSGVCVKQRCVCRFVLLLVAPDSQLSLPAIFIHC